MKAVMFGLAITATPTLGDMVDVTGFGHTGLGEVIAVNVVDGDVAATIRIRFVEPFTDSLYVAVNTTSPNAGTHPAYYDNDMGWSVSNPLATGSRANVLLLGY